MIIYFRHHDAIVAVESDEQTQKYRDAGWQQIDRATFIARWQMRDLRRLWELRATAWARLQAMPYAERVRRGI